MFTNKLEENKINYFLDNGALLGMYRDKNLISWDPDIELSFREDDFIKNKDKIYEIIKKLKFNIIRYDDKNTKIDLQKDFDWKIIKYTLKVWKLNSNKNFFYRKNFKVPSIFFNTSSKISCFNKNFSCPNNLEEYLTYIYGDWKVPIKSLDKTKYLSKNYYSIDIFVNVIKMIKKIFKNE